MWNKIDHNDEKTWPAFGEDVLVFYGGSITGAYLAPNMPKYFVIVDFDEYDTHERIENITHWMPLPKPPED